MSWTSDLRCSLSLFKLTFPSKGLRGLQGFAGTHRVLGWRVLPPLQTGQHGEVGTVLQPWGVLRPTCSRKREREREWVKQDDSRSKLHAVSGKSARIWLRARWTRFLTRDLIGRACLQLPASQPCVLNDKHTPALGQHGWDGFRAQSRPVTLQLQTAQAHSHSTASPVLETILKTNTRAHTESSNTQTHSFQGSVYVVIDGVIYGRHKKMVMLRKRQSVCYNLTCNSSGGLSGKAWGTERCRGVCVAVCWTVWLHVCVFVGNAMGWEGGDCQPYIRARDGTNQSPSRT